MAHQEKIRFRPGEGVSRVGLFGGTFDPVHLGHLKVALEVKSAFGLDRMIVIPSAIPPHKPLKRVSDANDRLAMARLCFDGHKGFQVSAVELERTGLSYTIDTIRYFLTEFPLPCEVMLIMGTDAFFEIHTWRAFDDIFDQVPLIVMQRPGREGDVTQADVYLHENIAPGYQWQEGQGCFTHEFKKPVYFFKVSPYDISSTDIRHRVTNGKNVSSCLMEEVAEYIKKKGLYR
ncbi:MAG: nicotinate-nucleotide adenylyltransferase [Desulfobacteraceae bacterium]|nr:nicotinate-nucleotide adenylyltransferase [Desulfobacteraceae bacterium]